MRLEQTQIERIRTAFSQMQSRNDLLQLLNDVKPLVIKGKCVPFKLKQLTWYSNPKLGSKRYIDFKINKKSGGTRTIHAPVKGLKFLQKTLSFVLQCVYEPHNAAMGFVRDRSIVENAELHVGSRYVYNIDLKDFFLSIDQARVWKCFQLRPFNLNEATSIEPNYMKWEDFKVEFLKTEKPVAFAKGKGRMFYNTAYGTIYVVNNFDKQKEKYILIGSGSLSTKGNQSLENKLWLVNKIPETSRLDIANIIAGLCCTEIEVERKKPTGEWEKVKRNVLPQGAPTSPVISNIVCQRLDYLLTGVAKRFGLKYSRYADDITFSSIHNVYQPDSKFLLELHRIIADQNFHIKESKTRLQKDGFRKEVTGLLVNERVNVQRRYIKQLRMWLYYWERYGYERAYSFFIQQYTADKGHLIKGKPDMANIICGKLDYLKMVKGGDDGLYVKLKSRYDFLTGKKEVKKELKLEPSKESNLKGAFAKLRARLNPHLDINIKNEIEEVENNNTLLMKVLLGLTEQPRVLSKDSNTDILTKVKTEQKPIPLLHKPKELVELLKNFSINDSALKYTTHSWDAGRDANMFKDLSEFLSIAKSQYNEFSYALKGLSENLNGKIYNFLFNKEIAKSGWGDINPKKRIYFGWSSPELLEACKNDISLNPEDFILPEKFQIQRAGKTLQKFKHIIDVFKNEIEVRDENSALLNLILQKHDNYLISFSAPKVSNLENKTFYTDIQWLGKALDLIFEGIQKYSQHPIVEYAVTENNNDRLVLTILHRNSFKNGLSIYDDKLNLKRGDFSTIKDKLQNLCDWCIESEFIEGAYRINYLVSGNENPAYDKIISAEGFKHILTFYK